MRIRDLANAEQRAQDEARAAKYRDCEVLVREILATQLGIGADAEVVLMDGLMVLARVEDEEFGDVFFRLAMRPGTEPEYVHIYVLQPGDAEGGEWYNSGFQVSSMRGLLAAIERRALWE